MSEPTYHELIAAGWVDIGPAIDVDHQIETDAWVGVLKRALRALARRAGDNPDLLRHFRSVREWATTAEAVAVERCRENGWSWTQIGEGAGMSRQAAHERWAASPAVDPWWKE